MGIGGFGNGADALVGVDRRGDGTGCVASAPAVSAATSVTAWVKLGYWHGKTSQGLPLDFEIVMVGDRLEVDFGYDELDANCPITGDTFGFVIGGSVDLHKDGSFKIRFYDEESDYRFSGT